jgi:hypothetical protein
VVLRPNEDDKRRNYDASTAPKGAAGLGERSVQDEANLFSRNGFQWNRQANSGASSRSRAASVLTLNANVVLHEGSAVTGILPTAAADPSCSPGHIP